MIVPAESLLRLADRGPRGLEEILRMAERGDWRTRALSLSAAGRIAGAETFMLRVGRWAARRVPGLRARFPSAGHHGKYVRNHIANALVDRSWIVRTAAALALGECRAPAMIPLLRPLLSGPYRAERVAAAAAIICCGENAAPMSSALLAGAFPAPPHIGESTRTIEFLTTMASCHLEVLDSWRQITGDEAPAATTAEGWAAFLAGSMTEEIYEGTHAEIERYDAEGETEYLFTKPFSRINRRQNVRLLHAFLVAAEHLRVPEDGRVLDLGAGSGWVSELLAKLGYHPITLDLSSSLLSIGKRRFQRENLTPRFAVGDMTRLPVVSGSVEAAMVFDALHHVPDISAVFREAYRVLAAGGQFILAEPGEGHSETGKSRGEMLEHGVLEREIHVFEAIAYGRNAGFDDVRIIPHYVPAVTMTPEDLKRAMASPADEWRIHQEDDPRLFSTFVIQAMLDRPIVVFRKGHRVVDSRLPRTLKAEVLPRLVRERERVHGTVGLRNLGNTVWLGGGDDTGYVRLGIQLLDQNRRLLNKEFGRTRLPANVDVGTSVEVAIEMALPDAQRLYVLKVDLVDEGICWFEDVGSKPAYVPV